MMEQSKALQLLSRQLKDIQAQADKIISGDNANESIEAFARYSSELKEFIRKSVHSPEIQKYLEEIPDVAFERIRIKLWQYILLPSLFIDLYKGYHLKNQAIQEINSVRGRYANLELLVRSAI